MERPEGGMERPEGGMERALRYWNARSALALRAIPERWLGGRESGCDC